MQQSAERAIVLGMDMGDARLIREWSKRGSLPNFASLISAGTWFDLETTAGVLHTSTWPTFATGDRPGKHGVYYPYQPHPGHQEAQLISPDQYGSPTFWSRASQQGARSIVFDVPETFPEDDHTGQAIFEWGTWAWYGEQKTQPDNLLNELKSQFGRYPLKMEAKRLGLKFPDQKTMEKRLIKSVEQKCEAFQWLLDRDEWDLAVMVFGETHPAGHYLWPRGIAEAVDIDDPQFDSIKRVYVAIDAALGAINEKVGDKTVMLVTSGDGVTTNHCGWHLIPDVLEKLGYSQPPKQSDDGTQKKSRLSLGAIKDMMPNSVRRLIADNLPWWLRDKIGSHIQSSQIDWSATRAFALPTDLEGCIRINLKGREPQGIVEPGLEYEQLCEKIASDMRHLVNPATGKPAVRDIWILGNEFEGAAVGHLPDITVTWNNDAPISSLMSERVGVVDGDSPDPRTGTHSNRAFCLATGPQFSHGASDNASLVDIAPTVLSLLGKDYTETEGTPFPGLTRASTNSSERFDDTRNYQ